MNGPIYTITNAVERVNNRMKYENSLEQLGIDLFLHHI